jgi:ABC-type glycerol-3-phosphate transport system permease component
VSSRIAVAGTPVPAARRRPARAVATSIAIHAVVITGSVFMLVPLAFMLSTSLKHEWEAFEIPPRWIPDELVWENYWRAIFQYFNFVQYGINTMTITVGVLVGRIISASLVAFGFARIRFFARDVLFLLVLSGLMVPHQVTIIPLYILFKELGWLNSYLPLIVPAWFGGGAFFIFLLRQFIMTISPELDDAARIDGCGWFGIYARIIMPQLTPALASVAIFSFLATWNDFFGPLIFLNSNKLFTLAIGLHFYTNAASSSSRPETTVIMAGSTLVMLPPLLLFFFAQRLFIQGVVVSGVKG